MLKFLGAVFAGIHIFVAYNITWKLIQSVMPQYEYLWWISLTTFVIMTLAKIGMEMEK